MENRKIVVAYDGSSYSGKALTLAATLAKALTAEVGLVSVIDIVHQMNDEVSNFDAPYTVFKKDAEYSIESGVAKAKELGLAATGVVLEGNPPEEIIKYAKAEHADMIVVGTRGKGGFQQLLLGSTAHALVTYSEIPVVVVK